MPSRRSSTILLRKYLPLTQIKVKGGQVDLTNTRMWINPFCEIAMQEAANLKDKKHVSSITALSIGPAGYLPLTQR